MVVIAVKPASRPGKMLKILEMLLDESLHTPSQSVALGFCWHSRETVSLAVRTSYTPGS